MIPLNLINKIRILSRTRKLDQLLTVIKASSTDKILDVGVANVEYSCVDNFVIKNYPYKDKITAIGVGNLSVFQEKYPNIPAVIYDGRTFPFCDTEFDIVHSNAVIEHVGNFERQLFFLKEMIRVGKRGMITTPNRYFPIELHTKLLFLHWLPKTYFDRILKFLKKSWASDDYMFLLGLNDIKKLLALSGLKNGMIIKNKFLGITMTYTILWNNMEIKI